MRIERIWIILTTLSFFAYLLGHFKLLSALMVSFLLLSTFLKGQLVIDYFMGLKETRLRYRLIPTLWLILILSLVALSYYLPPSIY